MAKSPKTRKLPRSSQSRPTAQFVTGAYTHSIQDLRAVAKKDMASLIEDPGVAARALEIATTHKDVHLVLRLLDAGAAPSPQGHALTAALRAYHEAAGPLRQAMEQIVDRMMRAGAQWTTTNAPAHLDRSMPSRWRQALVSAIRSRPLSDFQEDILLACVEIPEAVAALLGKGATWGRSHGSTVETMLASALVASSYPMDVLQSLKIVEASTQPNHAPGSNRLARARRFEWKAVLALDPAKLPAWSEQFGEDVERWARAHAKVDMPSLMIARLGASAVSSWHYSAKEAANGLSLVSGLVSRVAPGYRARSGATGNILSLAGLLRRESSRCHAATLAVALEDLVIRMIEEMGFPPPDLSALPDHGRVRSFCLSRSMLAATPAPARTPTPHRPTRL